MLDIDMGVSINGLPLVIIHVYRIFHEKTIHLLGNPHGYGKPHIVYPTMAFFTHPACFKNGGHGPNGVDRYLVDQHSRSQQVDHFNPFYTEDHTFQNQLSYLIFVFTSIHPCMRMHAYCICVSSHISVPHVLSHNQSHPQVLHGAKPPSAERLRGMVTASAEVSLVEDQEFLLSPPAQTWPGPRGSVGKSQGKSMGWV